MKNMKSAWNVNDVNLSEVGKNLIFWFEVETWSKYIYKANILREHQKHLQWTLWRQHTLHNKLTHSWDCAFVWSSWRLILHLSCLSIFLLWFSMCWKSVLLYSHSIFLWSELKAFELSSTHMRRDSQQTAFRNQRKSWSDLILNNLTEGNEKGRKQFFDYTWRDLV